MGIPVTVTPCCPRCGGQNFGIKEIAVQNANFRHYAILCTACGCVVGTETMQDDERQNILMQKLDFVMNGLHRKGLV